MEGFVGMHCAAFGLGTQVPWHACLSSEAAQPQCPIHRCLDRGLEKAVLRAVSHFLPAPLLCSLLHLLQSLQAGPLQVGSIFLVYWCQSSGFCLQSKEASLRRRLLKTVRPSRLEDFLQAPALGQILGGGGRVTQMPLPSQSQKYYFFL